ncbi:MAG: hypothetical protein ACRDRK_07425 [Pseudonocardia sp.]
MTAAAVVGFPFARDVWVALVMLAVLRFIPTVSRLMDRAVGRRGLEQ